MTLMDESIVRDLTELYNDGATPGVIQNALLLDGLVQADDGQTSFATRTLPSYYCGDRNKKYPNTISFDKRYVKMGKIGDSKLSGSCSIVTIHYKNHKPLKAIIANTFPHQALPNAYRLMEMYGKFCYNEFIKK